VSRLKESRSKAYRGIFPEHYGCANCFHQYAKRLNQEITEEESYKDGLQPEDKAALLELVAVVDGAVAARASAGKREKPGYKSEPGRQDPLA